MPYNAKDHERAVLNCIELNRRGVPNAPFAVMIAHQTNERGEQLLDTCEVMLRAPGESLHEILTRNEYLPPHHAKRIMLQLEEQVHRVWLSKGVAHGDVYPRNIEAFGVAFDTYHGVFADPSPDQLALFGNKDVEVLLMVGQGAAVHLWLLPARHCPGFGPGAGKPHIVWKCVTRGRSDATTILDALHPLIRPVVQATVSTPMIIPGRTPAIRDDAYHNKVTCLGNSLVPIDPFEWRGDESMNDIAEAAALVRAMYGKKYARGDTASIFREMEQDTIVRRAHMLRRDMQDAEHYLAVHPTLPANEDGEVPEAGKTIAA